MPVPWHPDPPTISAPVCHTIASAMLKKQLRVVRALLDAIDPFPARKGLRRKVMQPGQDRVLGFTLGLTKKNDVKDRLVTSQYNNKFPELLLACQRLIAAVDKKLVWNCIQVNKNQQTALHWDSYNEGPSVIVGLGDYEGGALLLHYKDGPVPYSVKESFLHFDGRLPHSTEQFSNPPRYTLVFFPLSMKYSKAIMASAPSDTSPPPCKNAETRLKRRGVGHRVGAK